MKTRLGGWWALGVLMASTAMGASPPIFLDGGEIETSSGVQQAMFKLLKSTSRPPTVQRPTARGTVPWLVQCAGAIREGWKTKLEAEGAVLLGYVPEAAFLVEATPEVLARVAALDDVAWAGEYLPVYKKSKELREDEDLAADAVRPCRVVLFRDEDKARIAREFGELGIFASRADMQAEHESFRVGLTARQIQIVAGWGEVEWIELDRPPRPWGVHAPAADAAAVPADVREALVRSYAAGERVLALGQGVADAGSYGAESRAVDRFVWEHPDMLVVAAAGNAATDLAPADGVVDPGSVGSPATAKNALAAGAAEGRADVARAWRDSWPEDFAVEPIALDRMAQADGPQGLAAFSGRGPCADGRIKPDLVAPGTFVVVPRPADSDFTGWGVAENTNEIYVGGTGVAAELVAAAARDVRQWLADERGLAAPSAALVKALLVAGARDLAPGQYGAGAKREIPAARPNSAQGFGLLDVAAARRPAAGEFLVLRDEGGLGPGQFRDYPLAVASDAGPCVLVLAYSDCGAALGAGKTRVNDLDLTVRTPQGAVLHPNGRTEPDDLNNVERIEFEADEAGLYVARVEARAVPMGGSQPYALVVRGPRTKAAPAAASEQP